MEYSTLNDILPLVSATGKKIVPFQKVKGRDSSKRRASPSSQLLCLDIDVAITAQTGAWRGGSGVNGGAFFHRPGHSENADAAFDVGRNQVCVAFDRLYTGQISSAGNSLIGCSGRNRLRSLVGDCAGDLRSALIMGDISLPKRASNNSIACQVNQSFTTKDDFADTTHSLHPAIVTVRPPAAFSASA